MPALLGMHKLVAQRAGEQHSVHVNIGQVVEVLDRGVMLVVVRAETVPTLKTHLQISRSHRVARSIGVSEGVQKRVEGPLDQLHKRLL